MEERLNNVFKWKINNIYSKQGGFGLGIKRIYKIPSLPHPEHHTWKFSQNPSPYSISIFHTQPIRVKRPTKSLIRGKNCHSSALQSLAQGNCLYQNWKVVLDKLRDFGHCTVPIYGSFLLKLWLVHELIPANPSWLKKEVPSPNEELSGSFKIKIKINGAMMKMLERAAHQQRITKWNGKEI